MPEHWARIDSVLQAVLECPPLERDAFLRRVCDGDASLESEVRSLLASYEKAENFLERPAIESAAEAMAKDVATNRSRDELIGAVVSHYQILGRLGGGGMGVVFKAEDMRLHRYVAIKFLSSEFAGDPGSLTRFRREARAASALNHPNICTVYDIGEHEGHPFIVMELLEGATLKERLTTGRIPHDDVVRFGVEILAALEAAHHAGIAHRDVKPANIFVTRSEHVKVLDFGVAKITGELAGNDDGMATGTGAGTILGTAAYMSPEQAHGDAVDERADLWAFGVVLYEMIVGARPVAGLRTHAELPASFEPVIAQCLEPDLRRRYQRAADVRAGLELASRSSAMAPVARSRIGAAPKTKLRLAAVAGVMLLILIAVFARRWWPRPIAASPATGIEYTQITDFTDSATAPALSPDGRMVAFIRGGDSCCVGGHGQIYVKRLADGESLQLTKDDAPKFAPAFTPDGSRVAYTTFPWDTWTVPAGGGTPARLLPNAFGLTWIANGRVMFSAIKGTGLHMGVVTSAETGAERRDIYYPAHERGMAHFSSVSPDGQSVLIVEMDQTGAFQPCRLVPFDGKTSGTIFGPPGACASAAWSPDGRWMYFSARFGGGSHVWRQAFPAGTPEQITSGPTEESGVAVAPDGTSLITSIGTRQSAIWLTDAAGERAVSSEGYAWLPRFSRDGARLFYLVSDSTSAAVDLRSIDLASGRSVKLMSGRSIADYDISADEKQIAFTTRGGAAPQIWLRSFDRGTAPRLVTDAADSVSFGVSGTLLFRSLEGKMNFLDRINNDGSGRAHVVEIPIVDKEDVSPDGEWAIVRASVTSAGEFETLAVPARGGLPTKVCPPGCVSGRWSPDGRFVYVESLVGASAGKTLAIPVRPGRSLPDFSAAGLDLAAGGVDVPGTSVIEHTAVSPGPSLYAFVKTGVQRNLFRITLR
jgi:serine/threonine protein kinase/dipeptidyl aminopeptidase/acylaminoacyl peptidase